MSKVFKAIGKAVGGVFKAIGGIVKAVVDIVGAVVNFVIQPFMGLFGGGMPDAGSEAQRQDGVLVQRQGSNQNIPVIYGMRQVGGIVTYAETGSSNNQYLWVAYVLGEGPVEGLWDLYIDDYQIPDVYVKQAMAGLGNVVSVGDGKYKDRVQFQFFPGYFYEEADIGDNVLPDRTLMKDAPSWKDTYEYNGMAVLFMRFYWKKIESQEDSDANPFSGNIPQIKATILGRKIQTLITGSDWSTYGTNERYSTNPAEILADYLRNPRYGKGLTNDDLDWDSFKIAAQKCNQEVEYVTDTFGPILTTNYVLDTGQTLMANTKILLSGSRMYMPYVQGKYKLKIEDAGNPTDILSGAATIAATFTPDNIQGSVTFTGIEKSAKYTSVKVTWVDPDNKWSTQQVVWPETETERQTYIDLDGGRENVQEATFGNITNYAIAKDMARLLFNKSRYQETCSFTASSQAIELEPGDIIRIQSNILDFDTDPWRIVSLKYNDNMTVELGCVRTQESIYPHTRLNEEDVVLPPYLPKGAGIYYPTSQNDKSIGLIPPTHVPGYNETDPNTSAGGGVGNPNESINGNTNPPTAIEIIQLALSDVADISNITFKQISSGFLNAQFQFVQPEHVMYEGMDFYYKLETENGFRQIKIDTKKGPGQIIDFFLDNLIEQQRYQAVTRVRYSTGEYSQVVSRFVFVPTGYPNFRYTPTDSVELVSVGWGLPEFKELELTNNTPKFVKAIPGTTGSTRTLTVSATENLAYEAPNSGIDGMTVYWRPTNSVYWYSQTLRFQQGYVSGAEGTFTITDNLGETGDTPLTYDFIFRYHYTFSGREKQATKQIRYMGADITNGHGGYGIFATSTVTSSREGVGDYSFKLLSQGVISDARDLTLPLEYAITQTATGSKTITTFGLTEHPTAGNNVYLKGVNVYARRYDPFLYPNDWTPAEYEQTFTGSYLNVSISTDSSYEYEFAVVPVTVDGAGTVEEAYLCYHLQGYPVYFAAGNLPSTDPKVSGVTTTEYNGSTMINYKDLWMVGLKDLGDVISTKQRKQIVGSLLPDVEKFYMRNYALSAPWGNSTGTNFLYSGYILRWSWENIGASYAGLRIYRRIRVTDLLNTNTTRVPARDQYFGLGRWEYVDFLGTYTSGGTNYSQKNIRSPISYMEYFESGGADTHWAGYPMGVPSRFDEFLFVILEDDGLGGTTESDRGIFMRGADWGTSISQSIVNITNPQTVLLADFNTGADSARQIQNAVQRYTLAQMTAASSPLYPYGSYPSNANRNILGITASANWTAGGGNNPE